MGESFLSWKRFGITKKFNLVFSLLLFLIIIVSATAYLSFLYIRSAESDIRKSTNIEMLVLEMDRSMEKARRLNGDFFLHYENIGLSKAHELYAQKSVRQIANAISLSSKLKEILDDSEVRLKMTKNEVDVALYLSSAKRFADTSIAAVELITQRAAPVWGVEAQLQRLTESLRIEINSLVGIEKLHLHEKGLFFYKDYLVTRQQYLMQSAFNVFKELHEAVNAASGITRDQKIHVIDILNDIQQQANLLLDIDRGIHKKFRDFSLQAQVVIHIPAALLFAAKEEVRGAEVRISKIHNLTSNIVLCTTLLGLLVVLVIARILSRGVIHNILQLTTAAKEIRGGNLDIIVPEKSQDELGQLAKIFNTMSFRLKGLVENLEEEVEKRTRELSSSEQRFRNLANSLPRIAIHGCDSERRVTFWNQACERLYGYCEEEALGQKIEDLIVPESIREGAIMDISNWLKYDLPIPSSEITLHHKYGHELFVYSSHVMLKGHQGEKEIYFVDIDLAELKLAQEKGRLSELIYRQLFNQSSSGIVVLEGIDDGRDFIFKDINKAGEEIENIRVQNVFGRRVSEILPEVVDYGLMKVFHRVWKSEEPARHPFCFYENSQLKGCRDHRVYKLPSGEIVSVFVDTTGQKTSEDEKKAVEERLQRAQKMEAIAVLAGGVAHDLNNILSGITGYPELLLMQLSPESELRNSVEAIKESGERAAAVVADLLTVARGVASTKKIAPLNSLVLEYMDSLEFKKLKTAHPAIQYKHELAVESPHINCSAVHVKKCLMNLVTNGSEAISGYGSVTVSTWSTTPEKSWAREHGVSEIEHAVLRVKDTGGGISQHDIAHIFEPFYTKKVMGKSGTGLGLAVVYNTAKDHGGVVVVESNSTATYFDLYFPLTKETVTVPVEKLQDLQFSGHGELLLLVDDEALQLDISSRMLTKMGYEVICKPSGEEAIEFLRDNSVDLVLLDMIMDPGINGRQTFEEVIKIHPGQKAVIVTGYSENEEVKKAVKRGAQGFLEKPYSMEDLGRLVRDILDS